jgi:DNA (cytosine-5)-methyltransferase 1
MRFRLAPQLPLNFHEELIVDNFAGGGGASTGIEAALGRAVDIAINHNAAAIAMHEVNHPHTRHFCESVWDIDPVKVCAGRPVGLAWFSPDCKHFSKAKGGKPVEKSIRGLAWIAVRWAKKVRPRVIILENVEEFQTWGPLTAENKPCPIRKGQTFRHWKQQLQRLGYTVEHRELRACDYGAPTIRKRLFVIARCDGESIIWPEPTHGDPKSQAVTSGRLKPWRTAAECIDWSIPCPSIFERSRPLADATLRRIAKGIMRYVVESADPFIVTYYGSKGPDFRGQQLRDPLKTQTTENRHAVVTPFLAPLTHHGSDRTASLLEPSRTVTGAHRGEMVIVSPTLIQTGYGERQGQAPRVPGLDKPLGTVVAGGCKHGLVSAFLAKHYGGVVGTEVDKPSGTVTTSDHHSLVTAHMVRHFGESVGSSPAAPAGTITAGGLGKTGLVTANLVRNFGKSLGAVAAAPFCTITGKSKDSLVTSHLVKLRGTCKDGQPVTKPMHTVTSGGTHIGEVRAFLLKYYGSDQDPQMREPMHTVTTKDRFGLVMVKGEGYQIIDIGMRMLSPRELFRAQGFTDDYIIDRDANGKPISKTEQVAKCGNSVCPPIAEAIVRANIVKADARVCVA